MEKSRRKFKGLNSIGVKVGILIVVVLIIILGAKSAFQIKNEFHEKIAQGETLKLEKTKNLADKLEKRFAIAHQLGSSVQISLQNTMSKIAKENRKRELIIDNIAAMFSQNKSVTGIGIYFEPNAYDGKDKDYVSSDSKTGRFTKYIYREENSDKLIIENDENTDKDWYKRAMSSTKTILIEPYKGSDGYWVTSYAMPISDNGNTVGVVIVDLRIDGIQKEMVENSDGAEDFRGLLTDEGVFVANAMDETLISKNLFDLIPEAKDSVMKAINSDYVINDEKIAGTTIEGKIIYVPVDIEGVENNWCFESVTSLNYFLKEAKKEAIESVILDIGIALFIGIVVVILLVLRVSKPMGLMERSIEKFANYNLDLKEETEKAKRYIKRKDEVGNVFRALHDLRVNLTDIVSSISSHAQNTAATSEELTATAQSTAQAATEVGNAVEGVAQGATSQAQDAQNLAIDIEKSNVAVTEMIEIVEKLTSQNDYISLRKDEGNESLSNLLIANTKTTESAEQISEIVEETNQSAEKIEKASEMIKTIAAQTNLLSLNAAIEAARAGEAGRGFSVVAEEVRELAEQSEKFATEVEEIVKELKGKTSTAVIVMQQTKEVVREQAELLNQTGEKFEAISKSVDENKEIVKKLDESSKVIEKANEDIIAVVQNLSAISEENAAATEEMSASVETQVASIQNISEASENLATIATELQGEATKFKL